jgi:hypothetical protein
MKAIYQIYIDNIRKGNITPKELDALEECIKQMDDKIEWLEREIAGDNNIVEACGHYE